MLNTPFAKTFMLLAVAAVIVAAFIYKAAEPRYGTPDPKHRVVHPAGFSVVSPHDWTPSEIPLFDGDLTRPYTLAFFENRSETLPAELTIVRLPARPSSIDDATPETVLDRPTYRRVNEKRKFIIQTLTFEQDGVWYEVTIKVPRPATPDELLAYVATLRAETPAAPVTTRPATQSARG